MSSDLKSGIEGPAFASFSHVLYSFVLDRVSRQVDQYNDQAIIATRLRFSYLYDHHSDMRSETYFITLPDSLGGLICAANRYTDCSEDLPHGFTLIFAHCSSARK